MRFVRQKINGPCGENCCQTRDGIMVVLDGGQTIDYHKIMLRNADLPPWDDNYKVRAQALDAFLERQLAKQEARDHAEHGAAVLASVLDESAFTLFADMQEEQTAEIEQQQLVTHDGTTRSRRW